jgi:hypothetical protein
MRSVLTCFLFVACLSLRGQVAVSYFLYPSWLSISTNVEKIVWGEYKLETNTFATNMNMELSPKINFKRGEVVNYYAGIGLSFNPSYIVADLWPINGYFIDIGARIKPFEKNRHVQIVFELSPYLNTDLHGGSLRTRLGLSYNFTRKHKTNEK